MNDIAHILLRAERMRSELSNLSAQLEQTPALATAAADFAIASFHVHSGAELLKDYVRGRANDEGQSGE